MNRRWCAVRRALAVCAAVAVSACGMNFVRPLDTGATFPSSNNVGVVMLALEARAVLEGPNLSVEFDRYDPDRGEVDGSCFRLDSFYARIQNAAGAGKIYFAFAVPPGHYAFDWWRTGSTGGRLSDFPVTGYFHAPDDRIAYIGDFVAVEDDGMVIEYDVDAARAALDAFPNVTAEPVITKLIPAENPGHILCTI